MPIVNRMAQLQDEVTQWRREFHANPELMYDVHDTARTVADKLRSFGCDEVVSGIGKTGVVAMIKGNRGENGKVVGLRADMDALPINELSGKPWASKSAGKMHACGHDGHTSMLLGAAKYLAETRNFAGHVALVFQPAEEEGAGGKAMVDDGMMERFSITEIYGMHNLPGLEVGNFAICPGPIMAASDEFNINITGKSGHAAMPHLTIDPIVVAAQIITNIQTIVSRRNCPLDPLVISVTKINAGSAFNVIPDVVTLNGTIRSLQADIRQFGENELRNMAEGTARTFGARAEVEIRPGYPVTFNHANETAIAGRVAGMISGENNVELNAQPLMGGEDFSYMLEARPGAFIFVGNGDTPALHSSEYDFNDQAIAFGSSYWVKLVETVMQNDSGLASGG